MAFTAANIAAIEAAIVSIATGEVAELEINGRRWRKQNLKEMYELLELMKGDVAAETYGASHKIAFKEVTN